MQKSPISKQDLIDKIKEKEADLCLFLFIQSQKSAKDFWKNCERGDWMLQVYTFFNGIEEREMALTKGHIAKLIERWVKDPKGKTAINNVLSYGMGNSNPFQLKRQAGNAWQYYCDNDSPDETWLKATVFTAICPSLASPWDVVRNAADAAAWVVDPLKEKETKEKIQQQAADICRKYLPFTNLK